MPPLSGYRIIELGDESGIFAGRLLADLGAEVIRVEPPGGDAIRHLAPFLEDLPGPERGYRHLAYNAGKHSVTLDLSATGDRARFLELLGSAHCLIDAGSPGWLANLGLDNDSLTAANPGLIRASISPFGLDGPWSGRNGSDLIASAAGGLSYCSGEPERPPIHAAGDLGYKLASLAACTGVLAALSGGGPAHIDVSVQECVAFSTLQTSSPSYWRWLGIAPGRNTAFEFPVVRCRDDRWAVIRARPDRWPLLREWALEHGLEVRHGPEQWRDANRTLPASFRLGEAADLVEQLGRLYDREQFLTVGRERGLMGLPLHTFEDMRECPQFIATGEFVEVSSPVAGALSLPLSPFAGMASVEPLRPAPLLGDANAVVGVPASVPPARRSPAASPDLPLKGLRVLELCWVLAGPLGCRLLADLGAEVIKVESERRMDSIRASVPPPTGPTLTAGGWFNDANPGKLSATINTTTAEGRGLLLDLAATCDIVIDNLRPGVTDRMGIPFSAVNARNPRTIVAHMPGAGASGPWAGFGTFGNMITGASGLNAITGFDGAPPTGLGVAFGDFVSPYLVASAVLAAVIERQRTGRGQEIQVPQLPGMVSLLGAEWMRFARTGEQEPRRANRDENHCPHGNFPAAGDDNWLAIAVADDAMFSRFCAAIERPELARDLRFVSHTARKQHEDALDAIVSAWSRTQDRWSAAELLQSHGVAAAAVESIADQLDADPQLGPRFEVVHPADDLSLDITVHGEQIRVAGRENPLRRAPSLGEHNEYVFRELLAMDEEQFVQLLAAGVIA
jgi:crotonobetainyl-CoA:carnitine CoA-transferase CaiB-like acyl-CoA transferase